jgi:hypothetical protein
MSFLESEERRTRTSFPSKILDYCQIGKPIVVWAPPYSGAFTEMASKNAILPVPSPAPSAVFDALANLRGNESKWGQLSKVGLELARTEFHADTIHEQFKLHLERTVNDRSAAERSVGR